MIWRQSLAVFDSRLTKFLPSPPRKPMVDSHAIIGFLFASICPPFAPVLPRFGSLINLLSPAYHREVVGPIFILYFRLVPIYLSRHHHQNWANWGKAEAMTKAWTSGEALDCRANHCRQPARIPPVKWAARVEAYPSKPIQQRRAELRRQTQKSKQAG